MTEDDTATRDAALRLLAYRRRGTAELHRALRQRGFADSSIERVIGRLVQAELLDDRALAVAFVRDGINLRQRGRARLRRELLALGIAAELADQALAQEYPAARESELASDLAAKQASRLAGLPIQSARRRLSGFLQRRGIAVETIHDLLDRHFPWDGDVAD